MLALRKEWRTALTAVVLIAAVACSSVPTPTSTVEPATPEPPGAVVRVAAVGAAEHRDLHQQVSEWATLFGPSLAYSRLLRFKSGPEVELPSMMVECDLCTMWQVVDPLTYEFTLNLAARWQESEIFAGRPVTADDVVFSLERLRTPGWPHASLLAAVRAIQAVDQATVRLLLHYPEPDLPQLLANPHAVIVAPEVLSAVDLRDGPVTGSGPWRWEQRQSGQTDLTPFGGYHGLSISEQVSGLRTIPVSSLMRGGQALQRKEVDIAQVTEESWLKLEQEGFSSRLVPRQGMGLVLGMNASRSPLDRLVMRQAVMLALDPQAALDQAWDGVSRIGMGVPVVEPGWLLDDAQVLAHFAQPQQAIGLLAGAVEAPVALELSVANYGPEYLAYGDVVTQQLEAAGFEVTLVVLTRSAYLEQVWQERTFQVFLGPLPPVGTTNSFLLSLLHSEGQWHITSHQDVELDRLIEEQSAEMDATRRGELVRQVQARVLDHGLLFMPAITVERWAYAPRVRGFHPNMAAGDGSFWRHIDLAGGESVE